MEQAATGHARDRRHGANYSIYGDVDVDALLATATPWAPFTVWRKGDAVDRARVAATSGVTIDIGEGADPIEPAILRFLLEDRPFLTAAARLVSTATRSVLTCRMHVHAGAPSRLALSPSAISQLAAARVELEIIAYPDSTADDAEGR